VRLRRLREEFGERLRLEWRSFLLRPRPDRKRTLDEFRAYTQSWTRPAEQQPDAGTFRPWSTDAGPPSHSIPPHLVAKAAAAIGDEAFDRIHERLMHAYFAENRDITDRATLEAIWREAGLPPESFTRADDPAILQQVIAEHDEAITHDVHGVPAVRMEGNDVPTVGAQPTEVYRRWVRHALGDEDTAG
jgi:predicted DsbA family dithiol-disulfide isomerase